MSRAQSADWSTCAVAYRGERKPGHVAYYYDDTASARQLAVVAVGGFIQCIRPDFDASTASPVCAIDFDKIEALGESLLDESLWDQAETILDTREKWAQRLEGALAHKPTLNARQINIAIGFGWRAVVNP
jgi:hypothetical protein